MPGERDSVFGAFGARALRSALPSEVCAGRLGELGSGGERSVPARCVVLGVPVADRRVPLLPAPPPPARRGSCAAVRAEPGPRQGPDTPPPTSAAGASRRCDRGRGGCRVGSKGCRWGGPQRGGASYPPPAGCGAARQGLSPRRSSARRDTEPQP